MMPDKNETNSQEIGKVMAQRLRALTVLRARIWFLAPTQLLKIDVCNSSSREPVPYSGLRGYCTHMLAYIQASKTHTHKIKVKKFYLKSEH